MKRMNGRPHSSPEDTHVMVITSSLMVGAVFLLICERVAGRANVGPRQTETGGLSCGLAGGLLCPLHGHIMPGSAIKYTNTYVLFWFAKRIGYFCLRKKQQAASYYYRPRACAERKQKQHGMQRSASSGPSSPSDATIQLSRSATCAAPAPLPADTHSLAEIVRTNLPAPRSHTVIL